MVRPDVIMSLAGKMSLKQFRIQLKPWTKTMEQPVLSMAKRIREKVPAYTGSKPWLDLK